MKEIRGNKRWKEAAKTGGGNFLTFYNPGDAEGCGSRFPRCNAFFLFCFLAKGAPGYC